MESCSDRYLHKKFKKQVNAESTKTQQQKLQEYQQTTSEEKENTSSSSSNRNGIRDLQEKSINHRYIFESKYKSSDDCVPKSSTNQIASSDQSSISNVVETSASVVEQFERTNFDRESANTCISRQLPNESNSSKESESSSSKVDNFDTKANFFRAYTSASTVDPSSTQPSSKPTENISQQEDLPSETKDCASECAPVEKSAGGKYVCSYCNLACSKPSVLQKHIRAHTNERPYPCISCGFSFKTRSNLYKHCRSRTHANRVMGNKTQEINVETEDGQNTQPNENRVDISSEVSKENEEINEKEVIISTENRIMQDVKSKPYKPRFHKVFFENVINDSQKKKPPENVQNKHPANSDFLSLHINEVISKNNAIVNSNESFLLRKRSMDNANADPKGNENTFHVKAAPLYSQNNQQERINDEPLNLSNKNRKRCMSEVSEPVTHKSLIKELLLKNLYADTNMQCPYCKMIFQTVTELELHKLRSCKGFTKSGVEYNRSNSVNVASILTHNKNALDSLSQFSNPFALKSPGPFLGKTRLVESDKSKSFSFDDNLNQSDDNFSSFMSPNEILKTSQRYLLSPLTIQLDKEKKPPVKMFGGEVKITHKTGETKSFKIDQQVSESFDDSSNFINYGGKLRENRVVKSSLQSGGTVLQGKPNYNKQDPTRSSPEVIRVYETTTLSPSIDVSSLEKAKFSFDRGGYQEHLINEQPKLVGRDPSASSVNVIGSSGLSNIGHSYKYTNIMDFSQKAAKLLAPNLKQPNLAIPGVPMPNNLVLPTHSTTTIDTRLLQPQFFDQTRSQPENERPSIFNKPSVSEKEHRLLVQKQTPQEQPKIVPDLSPPQMQGHNLYNPINILVNGKMVRYVPGMPGPVVAEPPVNVPCRNVVNQLSPRPVPVSTLRSPKPTSKQEVLSYSTSKMSASSEKSPSPTILSSPVKASSENSSFQVDKRIGDINERLLPRSPNKMDKLEVKVSEARQTEQKSPLARVSEGRSPNTQNATTSVESQRKFPRPNTLALKPSISALKQHHGLTPTMFNQILISPETPRVAKKYIQHFLNGNYFSYLGLKSSTRPTYCTLNKTQPFYVPHFKKLSMYSEWRQQESKTDELYVSAYDSRQKQQKYTTSGKTIANLVVHSSYKSEAAKSQLEEQSKSNSVMGGYESYEEYTYIRGRGRGRYVCDQCGIRCKKPSMLKKHIRTHTNDRPFTCSHCNFSFKTKGNLTKHMKSKSHTKNYAASSSSNSSTHQSSTQSSDSDTEDSGMDSSDDSTRQQEHEAAYGLLSLSQKPQNLPTSSTAEGGFLSHAVISKQCEIVPPMTSLTLEKSGSSFMNTEQVTHVNNTNYAKNKILDHQTVANFTSLTITTTTTSMQENSKEVENLTQFLGKTNTSRPLTYPYLSVTPVESPSKVKVNHPLNSWEIQPKPPFNKMESENFLNFKNIVSAEQDRLLLASKSQECASPRSIEMKKVAITISYDPKYLVDAKSPSEVVFSSKQVIESVIPVMKVNDEIVANDASDLRKRKINTIDAGYKTKIQRNDTDVMDLSFSSSGIDRNQRYTENGNVMHMDLSSESRQPVDSYSQIINLSKSSGALPDRITTASITDKHKLSFKTTSKDTNEPEVFHCEKSNDSSQMRGTKAVAVNVGYVMQENRPSPGVQYANESSESFSSVVEYDNSAMQTLADVATKQVKLEKNSNAKNVASEFLKLATKNEYQSGEKNNYSLPPSKDVNELIVKPEENKSCTICLKNFNKPSQLRLHMNIHYLERPFRCDSCSVSFRTKGHLQKHERSASHHNKLSSSPALSSSEPRPFKCSDCSIAFRIHGHLAKHLRSKMHIMKLECLAKIPFGLYAELERANSLLTEINTTDGDQCLESLKALAKKVFINNPKKLNQFQPSNMSMDS